MIAKNNDRNDTISKKSAEILLKIGSINFSPNKQFKLTSGKYSPVYCDCRRIISFPKERTKLINFAIEKLKNEKFFDKITNISGGETAGIPFSALIASKLNLPMTYIRKQKKKFGRKEQIEGILKKSEKVILVEDLITDGGSKLNFINVLLEQKAILKAILVIFNYGIFYDKFIFNDKNIKLIHLTSWRDVIEVAIKMKKISMKDKNTIIHFLSKLGVKNLKFYHD